MRNGLILLALVIAGCSGRYKRPANYSDDPKPLLAAARTNSKTLQSLTGQLRLEVWRGSERVRLRQLVATQTPDRLRIDSLSPFDQPLQTLVSDGTRLSIWAMDQKRFYRGAATPENLARLLPIRLEPKDVAALLTGTAPMIAFESSAVDWDADTGRYRLKLVGKSAEQELLFMPDGLALRRSTVWRGGEVQYVASFAEHVVKDGIVIPKRMRFEAPAEALKIDIEVVDYALNPTLPAAAWQLDPPRGVTVEPL